MAAAVAFISLVIAVAPMVAMLFFIWWLDRYDREPLGYVFLAFFWGAVGAILLSGIGSEVGLRLFANLSQQDQEIIGAVFIAPTVEELTKGLILFFLLRYRDFDNTTDGIVYGGAAGLGFGMTENFFYFTGYAGQGAIEDWLNLLLIRSVFTAYMHCAASATFGAGISRLKSRGWMSVFAVIGSYLAACSLHAVWNALVSQPNPEAGGAAVLLLLFYFTIIFLIYIFGIRKERKQRKEFLADEFTSGVIPTRFEKNLFSYRAMRKSNWFPGYLNKSKYLSLVSSLAMRKSAYAKASNKRRKSLDMEINDIRQELKRFSDLIGQIPN